MKDKLPLYIGIEFCCSPDSRIVDHVIPFLSAETALEWERRKDEELQEVNHWHETMIHPCALPADEVLAVLVEEGKNDLELLLFDKTCLFAL